MTQDELYLYIDMNPPHVMEPVFKDTGIRVAHIIDDFAKGMKEAEILKKHPELTEKHIQAAFVYCQTALKEGNYARYGILAYLPNFLKR